jgi:acyl carrier protein
MGIEAKLKALLQEIDEEIDPESITGDARLMADIGMSSVALLYMAVAVEETFGVDLSSYEMKEETTVNDIIGLIQEHSSTEDGIA